MYPSVSVKVVKNCDRVFSLGDFFKPERYGSFVNWCAQRITAVELAKLLLSAQCSTDFTDLAPDAFHGQS